MKTLYKRKYSKKLIFYQSISSIDYILHILKNSKKNECIIVVTGGSHFLEIIEKLKLKKKFGIKVFNFSQPKILKPFEIIRFLYEIKFGKTIQTLKKNYFSEAYFNYYNTDFVTPSILSLIKTKKIFFCKYKIISSFNKKNSFPINFKWSLKKLFLKLLLYKYNIYIHYSGQDGFRRINFKVSNKKIIELDLPVLNFDNNFLIPLNLKTNKKRVIFLDGNQEVFLGSDYYKVINKIFEIFKENNFEIIIKKKPGIPLSDSLKKIKKKILISSTIPIEFYDLKKIDIVVGISSTGQAYIANRNPKILVISCLHLFKDYKSKVRENIKNVKNIIYYLKARDLKKKILFPKDINDFERIVLLKLKSIRKFNLN